MTGTLAFALALLWKSALVVGGAWLTTRVMRRSSAATRHLIWLVALAALVVLPAVSLAVPARPIAILPAAFAPAPAARAAEPTPDRAARADLPPAAPARPEAAPAVRADATPAMTRTAVPWTGLSPWLLVWVAGALLVSIRLAAGYVLLARSARRAEPITAGPWRTMARRLAAALGLTGEPALLRTPGATMPMAWGVVRPAVLLPDGSDAWPDERRKVVLLHELAHIRRHDCLTQAIAQVACALYWCNPLVWMAARRLRAERELACDDLVLRAGAEGPVYAAELLALARALRDVRGGALASVAMARRSQLEGRLLAILDPSQNRNGVTRSLTIAAVTVLVVLLVPLAAVHPVARAVVVPGQPDAAGALVHSYSAAEVQSPAQPAHAQSAAAQATPGARAGGVQEQAPATSSQVNDKAVAALMEALKDPDAGVRRAAIMALGQFSDRRAEPGLIAALKDESPDVRRYAAMSLGEIGDLQASAPLQGALGDANADVRRYAAIALGEIGDAQAVAPLEKALGDASPDVRRYAAIALGEIGDPSAADALSAAMKDADPEVRRAAILALAELAGGGDDGFAARIGQGLGLGIGAGIGRSIAGGIEGGVKAGIAGGVDGGIKGGIKERRP